MAVERAVTENNNLPILKNVLLKVDSKVTISATNLELGVTHTTAGKVTENGSITVPFGTLYSIINNSDSERINLSAENNTLTVKTDNYEAKIQGTTSEEFPIIPKIEDRAHSIEINSETLREAVNEIISAVQISELKPELNGVLFDFQVGVLKLVATDGFRLAEKTLLSNAFRTNITKGVRVIIPLKTIQEVVRVFPKNTDISICIDSHQIFFGTEHLELISRLINGTYPDYAQIVPKSVEHELTVEKNNLITGIKLVSSFSGKTSDIKMRLKKDSKALEIYANNQYIGENNYLIPVKKKKEGGFDEIAFNWRYLMDGVKPMASEQVTIGVTNGTKPAIIRPAGDDSLFYIVMPIQS